MQSSGFLEQQNREIPSVLCNTTQSPPLAQQPRQSSLQELPTPEGATFEPTSEQRVLSPVATETEEQGCCRRLRCGARTPKPLRSCCLSRPKQHLRQLRYPHPDYLAKRRAATSAFFANANATGPCPLAGEQMYSSLVSSNEIQFAVWTYLDVCSDKMLPGNCYF